MANNTQLNINDTSGDTIATEDIGGIKYELVKCLFGADGVATKVSAADPLPITGDVNVDTSTLATSAKQDTGNTSLGSIDTKLTSQATAANQATEISALASILAKLSADPATQTTLAAVLAKLTSDPATQTTLAAILAKIIAAPATEAKQDTGNTSLGTIAGKDFATQTTLASILAKIIVAPSTEAKQDTANTSLASIDSKLTNPVKAILSGSTNGKGIKVVQTATAGTLIHTAVSGTSAIDEIWVYAYNAHTANVTLTIEFGEATVPDGNIIIDIPNKQGRYLTVDGRLLQNGLIVRAFASVANVIIIDGFVNKYS